VEPASRETTFCTAKQILIVRFPLHISLTASNFLYSFFREHDPFSSAGLEGKIQSPPRNALSIPHQNTHKNVYECSWHDIGSHADSGLGVASVHIHKSTDPAEFDAIHHITVFICADGAKFPTKTPGIPFLCTHRAFWPKCERMIYTFNDIKDSIPFVLPEGMVFPLGDRIVLLQIHYIDEVPTKSTTDSSGAVLQMLFVIQLIYKFKFLHVFVYFQIIL
jgi:hypothetical protein